MTESFATSHWTSLSSLKRTSNIVSLNFAFFYKILARLRLVIFFSLSLQKKRQPAIQKSASLHQIYFDENIVRVHPTKWRIIIGNVPKSFKTKRRFRKFSFHDLLLKNQITSQSLTKLRLLGFNKFRIQPVDDVSDFNTDTWINTQSWAQKISKTFNKKYDRSVRMGSSNSEDAKVLPMT